MQRLLHSLPIGAACFLLATSPAGAQSVNVLDTVVENFQQQAAGWEHTLQAFAQSTFGILAAIEITWAACKLGFRGADASEWMAEVVNQLLFLGFFFALLENGSTWGTAIVDSFRQAGRAAGGTGVAPSNVFAAGVALGQQVLSHITGWDIAGSAALMLAAIVIEVCFALMAAMMVVTLVQSYLVIAAGIINMAFGGSRWTKDIAVSTIRYTVSVGAKLMMLQLLVSVGQNMITTWAAQFTDMTNATLLIMIGCSIVMLAIVKIVPDEFQKVVGGASLASGSALVGAAAAVGGGVAGMAAGMAGVPGMAANATKLASAQLSASDAKAAEASGGQAPERSAMGRAATVAGMAARNMAAAPIRDLGRRFQGDIGARHGVATWRMSADLATKRRLLTDDQNKPQAAAPSGNSIS